MPSKGTGLTGEEKFLMQYLRETNILTSRADLADHLQIYRRRPGTNSDDRPPEEVVAGLIDRKLIRVRLPGYKDEYCVAVQWQSQC